MRNRRQRDREMSEDDMREYMARIDREKAEREAEREKQRKAAIVAAVWMD